MNEERVFASAREVADPRRNAWVERLARFGIATKGAVYLVLGVLAVMAAAGASGGRVTDRDGAVRTMTDHPLGTVLLVVVAVGMTGYALWRFAQAVFDPNHAGSDLKGLAKRAGCVVSAVVYGSFVVGVVQRLAGEPTTRDGGRTWLDALLRQGGVGAVAVGLAGAVVVGVSISHFVQAVTAKFMRDLKLSDLSEEARAWIERLGRFGLAARGVVFALLGWFLIQAAARSDASEWRGTAGALHEIAQQGRGKVALGVVAAGLAAYGAYQLVRAPRLKIGAS
ncbi:MAG: DUF1206 domain-containing protein [Polyangiales bacterium]